MRNMAFRTDINSFRMRNESLLRRRSDVGWALPTPVAEMVGGAPATTLCSRLHGSISMLIDLLSGLHESFSMLCITFSGLNESFSMLINLFSGLHESFSMLRITFSTLISSFSMLNAAAFGLRMARRGVFRGNSAIFFGPAAMANKNPPRI